MKDFFSLNRNIRLRLMITFISLIAGSSVNASMAIYYAKYLGAGITGILLIISSVASFATGIYAGHRTDQEGRRPVMLIGRVLTSLGAILAAFANSPMLFNPWLTFVGFLVMEFGFGFFNTGAEAMIVDASDVSNRKIVYSINYWIINLAIAIGSALSGWLFQDYLFELLVGLAVAQIITLLIVEFMITETFDPSKRALKEEMNIFQAYRQVSKDKIFMLYAFAGIFVAMFYIQFNYGLPVHLGENFHIMTLFHITIYGQRMLTLMTIVNTVLIVLFMNLIRKLVANWSNRKGYAIGAALTGLGFVMAFMVNSFALEMVAIIIETIGEMIFITFGQALMANMMNPEQAGAYTGVWTFAGAMSSILSGLMVSGSQYYGSFGMALIMVFVTLLAIVPGVRAIQRHEQRG